MVADRPWPSLLAPLVACMAVFAAPVQGQDCPTCAAVSVTPDNATTPTRQPSASYSETFTVTNSGSVSDTYELSCLGFVNITCTGLSLYSVTLDPSVQSTITAFYTTGGSGTGRLRLHAFSDQTFVSDTGWYNVPVVNLPPTVTLVAPVLTSGSRAVVSTRQPIVRALFLPNGSAIDTTKTVLVWQHGASLDSVTKFKRDSLSLPRQNHGLIEWEVDSARWLTGRPDSALITVTACSLNTLCTTVTRYAVLPNDSTPILGFAGTPLEALGRQFSAPFGPGLAVSGAEIETGFGIPSYVSMGASRSAGLVYSTRQSYPRALVPIDLEVAWPTGTPDQIKVILFDGVTKLDSLVLTTPTCATGATRRCRVVLQGDFANTIPTPTRKWLTVQMQVKSGAVTKTITDSTEVVLVDRRSTPYGSGWWPSAYLKLVAAGSDRVLVGPSGTAAVYRGNGDSLYLSPPGDFTTLVKTASGWELRPRGTTAKLVFDTNGRLYKSLDPNGNRDSIAFSGTSDQITSFVDPVGKTITLAYDANGKLSTFTDPGARQSKVTINNTTNQLTYDSISSPATKAYRTTFEYRTYPGTNTVVLWKRLGVIGDSTVVTYDSIFKRRPTQVTLPRVQDETGANVTPVINYAAYERRGFGAIVSLDSVYVELKDPRNNWTRSLLNRWGQARKTWDALGLLGRTEYTAEGFARWSEGKVADSSRAYSRYDALGRLAKTFIIRAAGDTLRTDSLVYDANHRVLVHIDARGKRDSVVYDANGNVLQTITPNGDVTTFWYRSDGLLDSTRVPGATKSRRFAYQATWKNLARLLDESNTVVDSALYDGLGRDTAHLSKLRVQVTATTSQWQWRRSMTFYNVANQVDSTRLFRTNNCADPCTSPPAWPAPNDTTRTQRVGHRFDRAGRDSLRLNDRGNSTGKGVLYLYDRLGRLVSRHPWWNDSTAVLDSFVYDVAGNLKKSITRRGDIITTNFDSRNRDTLAVIPGVGTRRKTFGGPLNQLTRLWYDSPVDSIGGVNAELRWGYDQRGRLKADTSYTGATARATTYAYDTYERGTTLTDALGTWTTRYETNRGIADTLLTPMGDTVTYVFDGRGRANGPYLKGGGPLHSRVPVWTALAGALSTLTDTVATPTGFTPLKYDRNWVVDDPQPAGSPVWTEQRAGFHVDSLKDSLLYDGWNRVIAMVSFRNAAVIVRDTFAFDRAGNLKTTAGAEVYDATTDRLTGRAGSGCTWSNTYDRAGNLTQAVCGSTTWSFGYTALNQLRTVKQNGTLIARYGYDVLGRRIAKRVYSAATGGTVAYTRFVYHGAHVAFETDSAGTIGLRYTWGIATDDLLAIRDAAGNHYYVVQDLLSSVRGLVKRDGTWMRSLQYGAYGALLRDTASASAPTWELRYRWTGREYDSETGLYFFRSRSYDPAARRFVQEDAIGYAGSSNVYAYGNGAPLDGRDPSGLRMDQIALYMKYGGPGGGGEFVPPGGGYGGRGRVYIDGAEVGSRWLAFAFSSAAARFGSLAVYNPWAALDQNLARAASRAKQASMDAKLGTETNIGEVSVGPVETIASPQVPVIHVRRDEAWEEEGINPIKFSDDGGVLKDAGTWVVWHRVTLYMVEGVPVPGGIGIYQGMWYPRNPRRYDPSGVQLSYEATARVWYLFGLGSFFSWPPRHAP